MCAWGSPSSSMPPATGTAPWPGKRAPSSRQPAWRGLPSGSTSRVCLWPAARLGGWMPRPAMKPVSTRPPDPVANMTRDNVTTNEVGAVLHYNCSEGLHIVPTPAFPNLTTFTTVSCDATKVWLEAGPPLACGKVCVAAPPIPEGFQHDWDNASRLLGDQVVVSCPAGLHFPNMTTSTTLGCEQDGSWTAVDPAFFLCREAATTGPPAPPPGMTSSHSDAEFYFVGSSVNFTCPEDTMSSDGLTYTTITYNSTGWFPVDPDFQCLNVCLGEPPAAPPFVSSDFAGSRAWGSEVTYTCQFTFRGLGATFGVACDEGEWWPSALPACVGKACGAGGGAGGGVATHTQQKHTDLHNRMHT
nr:CUB and sushi domain-containing protein 3-like [Penaeus vannamei]